MGSKFLTRVGSQNQIDLESHCTRSIRRILWGKPCHSYQVEMLSLILQENSFQFNGKDNLQTHGTAIGTKMAVAFANIFMAKIEKEILRQSTTKPIFWKRFIDDVISMWNTSRDKIEDFLVKANSFHPTIKFTAEISETETTFLYSKVYIQRWQIKSKARRSELMDELN